MLMVVPGGYDEKERAVLKGMTRQQKMDKAVEGYRIVVETAKEYSIPIGFENTPHDLKPLASMQDCEYLLEHVPGLEFVFDTANSRVADTCCNELEIYERLKKYIGRIHLKDVVIGEFASGEQCTDGKKIRCVPSGSGVIPIKELLHRIQEDGYEGMLTVEYAAPAEIHGSEHIEMARVYVDYITECLEREPFQTQYGNIDGIEKPVSRMFFGTAIEPMLAVERKAKNVLLVPGFVQKEETEKHSNL